MGLISYKRNWDLAPIQLPEHTVGLRCPLWTSQQAFASCQIWRCCGPGLLRTQNSKQQIHLVTMLPNLSPCCYRAYIIASLWRINKVTFKIVDNAWTGVSCHFRWILIFIMSPASSLPSPDASHLFPPHHSDWQEIHIAAMVCRRRGQKTWCMSKKTNSFPISFL